MRALRRTVGIALLMVVPLLAAPLTPAVARTATAAVAAPPPSSALIAPGPVVRGRVVNAANGNPVRRVRVRLYRVSPLEVITSKLTDRRGRFRLSGAGEEEFGIFVVGRPKGFENGWVACNRSVVATWGEACSHGTKVGRVRLERR